MRQELGSPTASLGLHAAAVLAALAISWAHVPALPEPDRNLPRPMPAARHDALEMS